MPAKTLLTATEALGRMNDAGEIGLTSDEIHADARDIVDRKNELVSYFVKSKAEDFAELNVVYGDARFVSIGSVVVDDELEIEAKRFIVATGSTIVRASIPGLASDMCFTSDEALEMIIIPKRLLVLGAGPVGCEFAQYFNRLGSKVTLVQSEVEILRKEDADIAEVLRKALTREGITVELETRIQSVDGADGKLSVSRTSATGASTKSAFDKIMIAAERRPYLSHLALEKADVDLDGDCLVLDDCLRTTNERVYAAGDVIGRRCLVHVAEWAGALAAHNAFSEPFKEATFATVETHAVYTQPQIAVTGMTEREASANGIRYSIAKHPFSDIGKAVLADEESGFVKMITDENDRIIGIGIVGSDALDLINEGVIIVASGMTARQVAEIPHLHPTMGEIYVRVAEAASVASDGGRQPPDLGD